MVSKKFMLKELEDFREKYKLELIVLKRGLGHRPGKYR